LKSNEKINELSPPTRSKGIWTDIKFFFFNTPEKPTRIRINTPEDREYYNNRIVQRFGIDPDKYSVLNIHKIGVDAPPSYVFDELLRWNGDSTCWPNHIARIQLVNNRLENIRVLLFGRDKYPFGLKNSFFGLKLLPLFHMNAVRIKRIPDPFDFDNARYLLYECSGGYPIGIFFMYVRSSIEEMGETEQSQLFLTVGFNFYGKEDWSKRFRLFEKIWQVIHNRVTANVLTRIKQLAEWRLSVMQNQTKRPTWHETSGRSGKR
jgi:hypothetical protein